MLLGVPLCTEDSSSWAICFRQRARTLPRDGDLRWVSPCPRDPLSNLRSPLSENMEMRVQKAHFEYVGAHASGGVEAAFVFQIRLKRKIQDKQARLPAGAELSIEVVEWENQDEKLVGKINESAASSFSATLTAECLDSEDRSKRVQEFRITGLRPLERAYKCLVRVTKDGECISHLQQHVVSYVDCPSSTFEQAQETYEKRQKAVLEIQG